MLIQLFCSSKRYFLLRVKIGGFPFDYEGQDSIKAKTLYSMMPFTYASVERSIEYVQHNEDQEEPTF